MKTDILPMIRHFAVYVAAQYKQAQCQKSAAALTYMTLFAIVPLMTVTYAMFSVIPAFQGLGDQLRGFIFDHFVPDSGQEVQEYLAAFSSQARSLTWAGLLMLFATAYLMLKNIEKIFNAIWGVSRGRHGLPNFLLYWAILSLGPLVLGVALASSTYLISVRLIFDELDSFGILPWLFQFIPWVLTAALFTLLFAAVPNCKVPVKHAITGGLITAVCFELVKDLFSFVVSYISIEVIYGAFAVVPLFLLWINLLWTIILAGAVLVQVLSSYKTSAEGRGYPDLVAALVALWQLKQKSRSGRAVKDVHMLAAGLASSQWQALRAAFLRHRLITTTQQGDYVLSRDLDEVTLRELAAIIAMPVQMPVMVMPLQQAPWFAPLAARLQAVDAYTDREFEISLGALFAARDEAPAAGDRDPAAPKPKGRKQAAG
ncbi:YihY family inner membrane protein [Exilibacterium tricleocarpae]|uniref:UPF0761 membrane protein FKG94_00260 n=1 Tax=Exilibacterium tricleocarpae TaxID=2591008 RepID=A0A545UBK9_9GAMM|nr:YihY family inner membrane protein [Exilibacterium tricleocarpae]TQV86813.1 YihY family inner membrane protein [Exilibacterium tricleocarpae]